MTVMSKRGTFVKPSSSPTQCAQRELSSSAVLMRGSSARKTVHTIEADRESLKMCGNLEPSRALRNSVCATSSFEIAFQERSNSRPDLGIFMAAFRAFSTCFASIFAAALSASSEMLFRWTGSSCRDSLESCPEIPASIGTSSFAADCVVAVSLAKVGTGEIPGWAGIASGLVCVVGSPTGVSNCSVFASKFSSSATKFEIFSGGISCTVSKVRGWDMLSFSEAINRFWLVRRS
mmetsp:Transcript_49820/g.95225  ORF Transcript_49820/g.95225 Transcript_49820/m.95225 type:complete len:234 (-) Transcript_49820:215-916(-)